MQRILPAAVAALALVPCSLRAQVVDEPTSVVQAAPADTLTGDWTTTADQFDHPIGTIYAFVCPAEGWTISAWGTDVYTDDSSICTAAVHAGVIGFAKGGTVVVEILGAHDSYPGSERNGVTTAAWDRWGRSFRFVVPRESTGS